MKLMNLFWNEINFQSFKSTERFQLYNVIYKAYKHIHGSPERYQCIKVEMFNVLNLTPLEAYTGILTVIHNFP